MLAAFGAQRSYLDELIDRSFAEEVRDESVPMITCSIFKLESR